MEHEILETTIVKGLGMLYLLEATEADKKPCLVRVGACCGYIYGSKGKAITPLSRHFLKRGASDFFHPRQECAIILSSTLVRANMALGGWRHPMPYYYSPEAKDKIMGHHCPS